MIELNSDEFIDNKLRELQFSEIVDDQNPKFSVNFKLSFMTLISGRKWVIFLGISLFPILISLISGEILFDNPTPRAAFVDVYLGLFYLFLFGWGALVISLPLTADEISDNMIDLYIVRPIRRDTFWLSRWLANFVGLYLLNILIAVIYFLYFHIFDEFGDITSNWDVFVEAIIFMFFASLTYSGLYLFITSLGDNGFTIGVMTAIFEPYFLSLLFLDSSKYIPRNNMLRLADYFFGDEFNIKGDPSFDSFPTDLTMLWALVYTFVFALIFLIGGALYYRRREFN